MDKLSFIGLDPNANGRGLFLGQKSDRSNCEERFFDHFIIGNSCLLIYGLVRQTLQ
jgi:hypothetical protein